MKSYDYEAVIVDGDVFCVSCQPEIENREDVEVSPIFADSERDSYPVCEKCGVKHDYVSLTEDGIFYEARQQNVEVFHVPAKNFQPDYMPGSWMEEYAKESDPDDLAGWYYWFCFPGCLPEGDPVGPFKTELEAAADSLEYS